MTICPACEKGRLKSVREKQVKYGIDLGTYPAQRCSVCHETFLDESAMGKIEQAAKKAGIWGLGKKTKVSRSGNSLAIRIPKELAEHLRLKEGKEIFLHPEKDRLIVELEE